MFRIVSAFLSSAICGALWESKLPPGLWEKSGRIKYWPGHFIAGQSFLSLARRRSLLEYFDPAGQLAIGDENPR